MSSVLSRTQPLPPLSEGSEPAPLAFVLSNRDLCGRQVGAWKLQKLLGMGGMAVVYEAVHDKTEQLAAIKLLLPESYRDRSNLLRFHREAQVVHQLNHPNIVDIFEFGEDATFGPYMALEHLQGRVLSDLMRFYLPLPLSWILSLLEHVCYALQAAHEAGVIHRDLKPSNLFLLPDSPFPHVKLLDFGIAKLHAQTDEERITNTGTILGTPAYLAPEQVKAKGVLSPATDIYSIGVLLFECLTGSLPFGGGSSVEHLVMALHQPAPLLGSLRPEFSDSPLEDLLQRTMAKDPGHRPASIQDFWEELEMACQLVDDPLDEEERMPPADLSLPVDSSAPAVSTEDRALLGNEKNEAPIRALNNTPQESSYPFEKEEFNERVASSDSLSQALAQRMASDGHALSDSSSDVFKKPATPAPLQETAKSLAREAFLPTLSASTGDIPVLEVAPSEMIEAVPSETIEAAPSEAIEAAPSEAIEAVPEANKARSLGKNVLVFGMLLLLVGGGAWLWWNERVFSSHSHSSKTSVSAFPRRVVPDAQTPLQTPISSPKEAWEAGQKALLQGQPKEAALLWRKALQQFPKQFAIAESHRDIAQAYIQAQFHHTAIHFLRLALHHAAPQAPNKQTIQRLIDSLSSQANERKQQAAVLLGSFQEHLRKQRWLLAFLSFQRLQKFAPDSAQIVVPMWEALGRSFPNVAKALVAQIREHLVWDSSSQQQVKRLEDQWERRLQRWEESLKQSLSRAQQLLQDDQLPAANAALKGHPQALFLRHIFGQNRVKQWAIHALSFAPRWASDVWATLLALSEQLKQSEGEPWLALMAEHPSVSSFFAANMERVRAFSSAQQQLHTAQRELRAGALVSALGSLKKAAHAWSAVDGQKMDWLQSAIQETRPSFLRANALQKRLGYGILLDTKRRHAWSEARFAALPALRTALLRQVKGSPAFWHFQQLFQRQQTTQSHATQTLRQAHRAFQHRQWKLSQRKYQQFLKMFPAAANKRTLQRRIKASGCALRLPWLVCSPEELRLLQR